MIESKTNLWVFVLLLVVIAGLGVSALLLSTPYGLGLVNDSAAYIGGAKNILEGNGYTRTSGGGEIKPITHFPPLFSLILAAVSLIGIDILQASQVTITFLFGVCILLVGLSVYKITHSIPFACFGALLLATSDILIGVYSIALSEPLFLALMLFAYLLLAEYIDRQSWYWLSFAGVTIGLAYLTRYAGISILISVIFTLILLRKYWSRPVQSLPLKEIGILLLSSLPMIALWMGYNLFTLGVVSNRQIVWHPVTAGNLYEGIKNLLSWIAPDDLLAVNPFFGRVLSGISLLIIPVLLVFIGWVLLQQVRGSGDQQNRKINGAFTLAVVLAIHILIYTAFLVISLSFFDATTPLDDRILSIIYIPELILLSSALAWLWRRSTVSNKILRWAVVFFSISIVLMSVRDGVDTVIQLSKNGQGFAYQGWRESEPIRAIQEMPSTIIYTDKPNGIFFWTGRASYIVPSPIDAVTTRPRPNYHAELERMRSLIQEGDAVLILFDLQHSTDSEDKLHFNDLTRGLNLQADYGNVLIYSTGS